MTVSFSRRAQFISVVCRLYRHRRRRATPTPLIVHRTKSTVDIRFRKRVERQGVNNPSCSKRKGFSPRLFISSNPLFVHFLICFNGANALDAYSRLSSISASIAHRLIEKRIMQPAAPFFTWGPRNSPPELITRKVCVFLRSAQFPRTHTHTILFDGMTQTGAPGQVRSAPSRFSQSR